MNITAIEKLYRDWGIHIRWNKPEKSAGLSIGGVVLCDPSLEPPLKMYVLLHELAHEKLHPHPFPENQTPVWHMTRETEANAVAGLVFEASGTPSPFSKDDRISLHSALRWHHQKDKPPWMVDYDKSGVDSLCEKIKNAVL